MHKVFLPRLLLASTLPISISGIIACGGDSEVTVVISASIEGKVSQVEEDNYALTEGLDSCPDPIIIQTDWFPEAEYGATYELFGDGTYQIDNENRSVSETLHDGNTDTGIGLEVRTGGPAIGFTPVASHMYTDRNITLGYANTEGQITRFGSAPLLSVVAPLE